MSATSRATVAAISGRLPLHDTPVDRAPVEHSPGRRVTDCAV
ncbi:hypothetical protein AB0C97_28300 [Streptomyces goshikiensis]